MREVICIPWRGGQRDREAAFSRTWRHLWEPLGIPLYTGDSRHERFHRAASRNEAARNAGDWDVALFADADVRVPAENVEEALARAYAYNVVVYPHDRYQRLDRREQVYQSSTAPTNGGALAISREAWELVQGYDERFAGWGFEDAAFYAATSRLLGPPIRLNGFMRELHHDKTGRGSTLEERELYERYRKAERNMDERAMLRLVNEDPLR